MYLTQCVAHDAAHTITFKDFASDAEENHHIFNVYGGK